MNSVHNKRPYIVFDSETYECKESKDKPVPKGSALFTLNSIETFLKKYLNDPVAQQDIEFDPEVLKDRMQQIKIGYDEKFEELCWGTKSAYYVVDLIYSMMNCLFSFTGSRIRFETEQVQIDKTLLRINNLLKPPSALPSELVVDTYRHVFEHFDFATLCKFALVNREGCKLATSLINIYASDCGFQGDDDSGQAKSFMTRLIRQVSCISRTLNQCHVVKNDPNHMYDPYYLLRNLFSCDSEKALKKLKEITTNEMISLFSLGILQRNKNVNVYDFYSELRVFLCHVGGDWEKTPTRESMKRGLLPLKDAIDHNNAGFVKLLLQHGIEPIAKHLTSSLEIDKNPEISKLLLAHEASNKKERKYIRLGYKSSSFEIRKAFYDFNLNYSFSDDPLEQGVYTVDFIVNGCRLNSDRILDLKYVLDSATVKGTRLGVTMPTLTEAIKIEDHEASDFEKFEPLSLNYSILQYIFKGQPEITNLSEIVFLLLEFGCSVGHALIFASALGHKDIVEKLLQKNSFNYTEKTFALWAACGGYQDQPLPDFSKNLNIINMLLQYGANPKEVIPGEDHPSLVFGGFNKSALEIAQERSLDEIVEVLRSHQNEEQEQST